MTEEMMDATMPVCENTGSPIAVSVENASVRFNMASERIDSIKEYMIKLLKHQLYYSEFMALTDISLTVRRGESWGLVGANGAGKSTLLKLISGILKPYRGSVRTYGTIAPLIELGAGFNPELTARENIFLNGALLGHSKKYLQDHFAEIVDFAELWDFLDMPIKNYSSGMSARLGFSVATMVRPDILIADEILAVGDYAFQQKCKSRMKEMLSEGMTLLFVSHSAEAVKQLCQNAVWIEHGHVHMIGRAEDVCDAYLLTQGAAPEDIHPAE